MADLQKFRAHESLNTDTAADWLVTSGVTDAASSSGSALSVDVSEYTTLGLYAAGEIYIRFTKTSTATITQADDLKLAAGLSFIKIPSALGDTIYFNYQSTTTTAHDLRIVKM
tara:strand:+ start:72 stop:410 length:339 start_codon:yes stop_codon:yes gene_type:complete